MQAGVDPDRKQPWNERKEPDRAAGAAVRRASALGAASAEPSQEPPAAYQVRSDDDLSRASADDISSLLRAVKAQLFSWESTVSLEELRSFKSKSDKNKIRLVDKLCEDAAEVVTRLAVLKDMFFQHGLRAEQGADQSFDWTGMVTRSAKQEKLDGLTKKQLVELVMSFESANKYQYGIITELKQERAKLKEKYKQALQNVVAPTARSAALDEAIEMIQTIKQQNSMLQQQKSYIEKLEKRATSLPSRQVLHKQIEDLQRQIRELRPEGVQRPAGGRGLHADWI